MTVVERTCEPFVIYTKHRKKNDTLNAKAKEKFRERTAQKQLSQQAIYRQALETPENVMITSHACLFLDDM